MYGSMMLTIEANKENIPPGFGLKSDRIKAEPIVLPEDPPSGSGSGSIGATGSVSCQESPIVTTSADEGDDDQESTSRKEKSLGLLCQRFLIAMNEETRCSQTREVHLETVARKMNVEKRRIYDIVNVMEALDAMQKTNKSYYQWQGLEDLPKLMFDLQNEAVEEGLPERVARVEQAMCSFTELSSPAARRIVGKDVVGTMIASPGRLDTSSTSSSCGTPSVSEVQERRSRVDNRDRQGRNSLAQLCRRFLMVLLSNPRNHRKVSLDVASTVLIKDPETEGFEPPSRSRCRRLYDIANVLVALGLIKKVHYLFGTKKIPLFVYCGPEPDEHAEFDVYSSVERLLSSQQNTPSTPTIKATTDKIVQQLAGFGKRSNSDIHLDTSNKLAKIRDSPRVLAQPPPSTPTQTPATTSALMMFAELAAAESRRLDALMSTPSLIIPLSKPHPQKPMVYPFFEFPTARPMCSALPFAKKMSPMKQPLVKHSMSNILSASATAPVLPPPKQFLDHTATSPFQVVVKKEAAPPPRQKKVFGEIQNFH